MTFTGHFASGLYAFHAAASASSELLAGTSTNAIQELPSGASRIVAGPCTRIDQSFGAMNVLPATVVFGVSAANRSLDCGAGAACARRVEVRIRTKAKDKRRGGRMGRSGPRHSTL